MRSILVFFCLSIFTLGYGQGLIEPVKWSFDSEKVGENEYKVKFTADVEEGWAIYSQFIKDGGPIATSFAIEENSDVELLETVVEPEEKETKFDEMFDMELIKLKGQVEFYQMVKTSSKDAVLKGYLTFMCCDDKKCLPPTDIDFEIPVE